MNVLEVYPTFSWWLCGSTPQEIAATREELESDSSTAEKEGRAFYLVGDAAAFDLVPEAFDEINVRFEPTALKRLVLQRHTRGWLKAGGQLRFEPKQPEKPHTEPAEWRRLSIYSVPALPAWQHH